jgi:Protein of unknown function (DUF1566)
MKKSLILAGILIVTFTGQASLLAANNITPQQEVDGRLLDLGNGTCQDMKTGQIWQQGTSKKISTLENANEYAKALTLGGYNDWRLPTVTELYDLHLTVDLHENGNCTLKSEGSYWSDEPDNKGRVGAWEMDDNCDPERQYTPKNAGRIRAIRDIKNTTAKN